MTAIINGSSPSVTFSDGTTQATSAIVSGYVPYANLPTGSVLQVVQATYSTASYTFNTTSSTLVATGLTATITPKSSTSKILVICHTNTYNNSSSGATQLLSLYRGSTNLNTGGTTSTAGFTPAYAGSDALCAPYSIVYLDSPATTSATTYQIYAATNIGTMGVNVSIGFATNSISTLTLMEIAG
jgi:hypothetical protein